MKYRLIALLLSAAWLATSQDDVSFRSGVSLVHVDTEVLSKRGEIVKGLALKDFRVFDEGREQKLISFSAEEQPLDLILLFDISASMRPNIAKVAAAARQAAAQLRRGDRVAIMCFNFDIAVSTPFVEDMSQVAVGVEGVLRLQFGGGTAIRYAVNAAAQRFTKEPYTGRRRAILVITDNVGAPASEIGVVHNLWDADAVVSALVVWTGPKMPKGPGKGSVDPLAERSGGAVVRATDPGRGFVELIERIRSRYSLYYATPEGQPGTYHSIRVELGQDARSKYPNAKISTRQSYRLTR
ncbi:MAG: von Willebrand factor, type [Bryobacterales bacterium]|nr:von Willebrand factor, type [Bryobacterales bacterium]